MLNPDNNMAAAHRLTEILSSQRLYGIVDTGYVSEEEMESVTRLLAEGGVRVIQFRAKNWTEDKILEWSHKLAALCKELDVLFIVNDYPHIAAACGAEGVHVGQDDGSLEEVRAIVGPDMIIGRSTHSCEQALEGYREGADYIGFGPLFLTNTKPGRPAIGLEDISRVHETLPEEFPVFCIGGVQPSRMEAILQAGGKRVVIVSWLLQHEDVSGAARSVISRLKDF